MKTTKIVYNNCFGAFSLSESAIKRLSQLGVKAASDALEEQLSYHRDKEYDDYTSNSYYLSDKDIARHDPLLVQVVEELRDAASGSYAELNIAEIHGNKYRINEYDGKETIVEPHQVEQEWIIIE